MAIGTGGDGLVAGIKAHGIDTVFGLPGAQVYGLFDALHRGGVRVVGARHEQACGYMAFGYARATGQASVFAVVPGPGVLNAGAAALTAFGCNEPILCLTGEVPMRFLGQGSGHLHEMPNQLGTMRSFYKRAERVEHPGLAASTVSSVFQTMLSGRRGPGAVEMPWEVFTRKGEIGSVDRLPTLPPPPVDSDKIRDAARLIASARNPMIFVGSGAFHAAVDIQALAERLEAPVVAFRSGRGILSNAHPLGLTIAEAYELWPETDLVIGIGTRMEVPRWRWPYRPEGQKTIRIDIDPVEMRRSPPDVAIVADAAEATAQLLADVERSNSTRRHRMSHIADVRAQVAAEVATIKPQIDYLKVLREVLPADGIVTDELSQVGFTSWYGFPVYQPRTLLSSGYQGNLGSGFPTALGAKVAFPARAVVAITGDGGFMFNVQELATAVQYGIAVVVLVFNNRAYGNVRRDQIASFDGRVIGADLVNPDFVKLANSFGVEAERVSTPDQFRPVLERAIAANAPWLIEIETPRDSEVSPWRFIHPAKHPGVGDATIFGASE
jgi:acetolactate synthase I/II/III large subunit